MTKNGMLKITKQKEMTSRMEVNSKRISASSDRIRLFFCFLFLAKSLLMIRKFIKEIIVNGTKVINSP